jgi:hypothetical protein
MKRIHLEDHGQDFLHFDYDEKAVLPKILNGGPYHGHVFNGCFIMNPQDLKVGNYVQHSKSPLCGVFQFKYPIVKIEDLATD